MTTSLPVLRSSLDALSSGDLNIREARSAVRRAIGAGAAMVEHAYVSLRGAAWRMISARQATEDLGEGYDIYTHAAALARRKERPDIAERLTTLAELVAQTGRFADRQPLDEVLERRHVKDLLVELARNGGSARRVLLADATELADANLSRVLAILGAHGLILRKRSGKEALLSLTQAGCAAAAKVGALGISSASLEGTRWWEGLDVPVALWTADGDPIGSSSAFRELVSKAGYHGPSTLDWRAWTDWVESALQGEHSESNVSADNVEARVLQLSDGRWVRYAELCFPDSATCVWLLDVSAEKQAEASLSRELRARDYEITKLKERIAEAEHKAEEHKRRVQSSWSTSTLPQRYRMSTLDEIAKEEQRVSEALARIDAQREKLSGQLGELEATERVLARYSTDTQAKRTTSRKMSTRAAHGVLQAQSGRRRRTRAAKSTRLDRGSPSLGDQILALATGKTQQEIAAACKGVRPNHIGISIARHKRAGRIEERDGKLYTTRSTGTEQHAAV